MSTNGRGSYQSAILSWRWRPEGMMARGLAHRIPADWTPRWVAVVPPTEEMPDWIPADARRYVLPDGDQAIVW